MQSRVAWAVAECVYAGGTVSDNVGWLHIYAASCIPYGRAER
jgi:hypothetical protein